MSGSIDYAALFVTSSSSSQSLLDTIYGISSSSSSSGANALQALSNAEQNQTQEVAARRRSRKFSAILPRSRRRLPMRRIPQAR